MRHWVLSGWTFSPMCSGDPYLVQDNEIVLEESIRYIISLYRNDMKQAGIGHAIPIHVTENGWPTGEGKIGGTAG